MLPQSNSPERASKCIFTSSVLPAFVDAKQIPEKKRPFSLINEHPALHNLDILLPQSGEAALRKALGDGSSGLSYARVHMKLDDIVTGDFLNEYIKKGSIIMLSEGRRGIDQTCSLVEGVLRLEVNKAMFQRMGLEGKPISGEGRKHGKARYAIELNLRLPSMVRGKPGFERILWTFRNVLDHSVTWLFHNINGPNDGTGPISKHEPVTRTVDAISQALPQVTVPSPPQTLQDDEYDTATDLLEWLTLIAADSPRVRSADNIDSYLSRYRVPVLATTSGDGQSVQDLTRLRWHGFIPARKVQDIYLSALKVSGDSWFALHACVFDGEAYTVLQNSHHTLTWGYMI